MQKKIFYLYVVAMTALVISQVNLQARRFRPFQPRQYESKDKLKITVKSTSKNENSPFSGLFKKNKQKCSCIPKSSKSKAQEPALYDKIGFDWAQTTTQNLETSVGYFLSIIPDDQDELRSSLKKKESKTKDRIKAAEVVGDQNYKEAEFLSDKLAMVANWHQAAQEQFKLAVDKKEESMGGLMYKDFVKAKAEAQKELLYEIYAMLDGVCPNPTKPVDQDKLSEKINEVIEDVFSKIEKPKSKTKKRPAKEAKSEKDKETPTTKDEQMTPVEVDESDEVKKLQESQTKLKEDLANAQEALKEAEKEKAEAISKAEKLKNDLESEQRSLKAEEIKREIELKRTANEKVKLESKNALLEKKIQELEDKKMELKTKIEVLSENVKQESTGKTMTSIDLEKIRRQKDALEKKLEKQKQKINEYLNLLSSSDAKQKENEVKQINLEIEIKKLKQKIAELETEKTKNLQKIEQKTGISENKPKPEPLILDVEKDSKKLNELASKPEPKKTVLGEAQSLFDEFPNPKTEKPDAKPTL